MGARLSGKSKWPKILNFESEARKHNFGLALGFIICGILTSFMGIRLDTNVKTVHTNS